MMDDGMGPHGGGPIVMLLIYAALIVPPFWQIFTKAGFSPWWSLLMVIPLVNLVTLWVLGFATWPAQSQRGTDG